MKGQVIPEGPQARLPKLTRLHGGSLAPFWVSLYGARVISKMCTGPHRKGTHNLSNIRRLAELAVRSKVACLLSGNNEGLLARS